MFSSWKPLLSCVSRSRAGCPGELHHLSMMTVPHWPRRTCKSRGINSDVPFTFSGKIKLSLEGKKIQGISQQWNIVLKMPIHVREAEVFSSNYWQIPNDYLGLSSQKILIFNSCTWLLFLHFLLEHTFRESTFVKAEEKDRNRHMSFSFMYKQAVSTGKTERSASQRSGVHLVSCFPCDFFCSWLSRKSIRLCPVMSGACLSTLCAWKVIDFHDTTGKNRLPSSSAQALYLNSDSEVLSLQSNASCVFQTLKLLSVMSWVYP